MNRVGKTIAASAALAWLLLSTTQLSAADMSESALNGDTYQCPEVAPEDPDALAEYEAYACAAYNVETGSIGEPAVAPADEQLPAATVANEAIPPVDGAGPPVDGAGPPDDGGETTPPVDCPPGSDDENCVTNGETPKGNNGVGNGLDPQPPGNPPINDGTGTSPGNPGNQGGANN